jgi:hypothetical protein
MRSYIKEVTVEDQAYGNIISRKVRVPVFPILDWFDQSDIYHELTLFGSDLDWLSQMHITVEG